MARCGLYKKETPCTAFTLIEDEALAITAQDAEIKCDRCCVSLDMCPELLNTAGYTYVLAMWSTGRIKIEYTPCGFNGGKERIYSSN